MFLGINGYKTVTVRSREVCYNKIERGRKKKEGNGADRMSRGKILVIEDEESINALICMNLEAAGYETVSFGDGGVFDDYLDKETQPQSYGLAVLDVMLPGKDGFALLPKLQSRGIPVLFLTAKGDVDSKVKGLSEGAEDYLVKPFEMLELLVRIEKILKRSGRDVQRVQIGEVEIFPQQRRVERCGREVSLTPMEFDCLMLLLRYRNMALSREQMLRELWGVEFDAETRTIDAHIGRIRKKLGFGEVIRTVPHVGYRMEV